MASGTPMVSVKDVRHDWYVVDASNQVLGRLATRIAMENHIRLFAVGVGTPEGSTIRIQSRRNQHAICLRIFDEGAGISPEDLERIFDKFYRAQKGDRVRAGTGLGLPISRGFVEAMGGTITAANRSDRSGAVFTITLPVPAEAHDWNQAA